jgi:hypothetical protein
MKILANAHISRAVLAKVFFSAPPKRSALPAAGMMTQYFGITAPPTDDRAPRG